MQRWVDRIAMVTGASSGIGAAITYQLLDNGVNVVALARRAEQIEEAVNNAKQGAKSRGRYQEPSRAPGKLHTRACDVTKEDDILSVFRWVRETLGGADILINNAGLGGDSPLTDTKTDVWKHMLDVNVVGLSVCTREAVQSMRARGVDDGHVVHICSMDPLDEINTLRQAAGLETKITTRYGNRIICTCEEFVVFLPARFNTLSEDIIESLNRHSLYLEYLGIQNGVYLVRFAEGTIG